jgi:hypothetical protein
MGAAAAAATTMNSSKTYDIPAQLAACAGTAPAGCLFNNGMGTFGAPGAMKALDTLSTARDDAAAGKKNLPGLRSGGGSAIDTGSNATS